jgi:colicin import membrane protein
MTRALKRKDPGPGGMFVCSILLHAVLFLLMTRLSLLSGLRPINEPVYYVDVVNLPVASPQAGSPSGSTAAAAAAAPPAPKPQEMKLPAKPAAPPRIKPPAAAPARDTKTEQAETAREFEERLARLERNTESRHQAAALDALRKRTANAGKGQAGMPGGTGKEAGSDYSSYIQSRLKDAFKATIAFQTKSPEVRIRLTIDRGGRVTRQHIEYSTGDRLFEAAVLQAVARAEKGFPPPPGGQEIENGFVFKPQGVGKN